MERQGEEEDGEGAQLTPEKSPCGVPLGAMLGMLLFSDWKSAVTSGLAVLHEEEEEGGQLRSTDSS